MRTARKRERNVMFEERYVPADGSRLEDPKLGYLIAGFTAKGDVAQSGERFYNAMWSRDTSGTCSSGQHEKCAHRPGGRHQGGMGVTGADGLMHVWHCGCDCHQDQIYSPSCPTPADAIQRPTGSLQLTLFGGAA